MNPDLIVTFEPTHTKIAGEEIKQVLKDVEFLDSDFEGLFLIKIKEDPKKAVARLHKICRAEPFRFKYTTRWIPVEKWVGSEDSEMEKAVKEFSSLIKPEESWKMDIAKRGKDIDTASLIRKLTEHINRPKVDLKKPDKLIKIEIIGSQAAISLLNADEYLVVSQFRDQ